MRPTIQCNFFCVTIQFQIVGLRFGQSMDSLFELEIFEIFLNLLNRFSLKIAQKIKFNQYNWTRVSFGALVEIQEPHCKSPLIFQQTFQIVV